MGKWLVAGEGVGVFCSETIVGGVKSWVCGWIYGGVYVARLLRPQKKCVLRYYFLDMGFFGV